MFPLTDGHISAWRSACQIHISCSPSLLFLPTPPRVTDSLYLAFVITFCLALGGGCWWTSGAVLWVKVGFYESTICKSVYFKLWPLQVVLCRAKSEFSENRLTSQSNSNIWWAEELISLCAWSHPPIKTAKRCENFRDLVESLYCILWKEVWREMASRL